MGSNYFVGIWKAGGPIRFNADLKDYRLMDHPDDEDRLPKTEDHPEEQLLQCIENGNIIALHPRAAWLLDLATEAHLEGRSVVFQDVDWEAAES